MTGDDAYNLMVTSDEFLSLVRDYEAATGRYPHLVVINPEDQDQIDADIAAGAPSPQVPMLIRRDPAVPAGQPQFPLE